MKSGHCGDAIATRELRPGDFICCLERNSVSLLGCRDSGIVSSEFNYSLYPGDLVLVLEVSGLSDTGSIYWTGLTIVTRDSDQEGPAFFTTWNFKGTKVGSLLARR